MFEMCLIRKSNSYLILVYLFCVQFLYSQNINNIKVNQVTQFIYDEASEFSEGLASVNKNGSWYFIDKTGKEIINCKLDENTKFMPYSSFSDGMAIVRLGEYYDRKFFFINKKGSKSSKYYKYASKYINNLACVEDENWRGLVNLSGDKVLKCACESPFFKDSLLLTKEKDQIRNSGTYNYKLIDINGNIKFQVDDAILLLNWNVSDDCVIFYKYSKTKDKIGERKRCLYITDFKGNILFTSENYGYDYALSDGCHLLEEIENNTLCLFFPKTKKIIKTSYSEISKFSDGISRVKLRNGKFGFINIDGTLVNNTTFDNATVFSDGLSFVKLNKQSGFIDKKGNIVIPTKADYLEMQLNINDDEKDYFYSHFEYLSGTKQTHSIFKYGVAKVEKDNKWGLIDNLGNEVLNFKYDFISDFFDGYAVVGKGNFMIDDVNNKKGLIDKFGNEIVPCIYEDIKYVGEGMISAKLNGKNGFLLINN